MTPSGKLKTRTPPTPKEKKNGASEKTAGLALHQQPKQIQTAFRHPDILTGTHGDLYAEICSLTLVISPVSGLYAKRKKSRSSLHLSSTDLLT